MSLHDWRTSLSFSDRFAAITTIQDALDHSRTAATQDARSLEDAAYGVATSREQYDALIATHLRNTEDTEEQPIVDANSEDELEEIEGGVSIGVYSNAVHHKDGVTSTIWRAKDHKAATSPLFWRQGLVALKVVRVSAVEAPHDVRREIRLLQFSVNDRIVTLLNHFTARDGCLVLVFPFLPQDLGGVLAKGALPGIRARAVLGDLMRGLAHIHRMGIIHRDIKPSNILLRGPGGPAVLADFGIAWSADDQGNEPADLKILDVGTTSYRPPELLFGNQKYDSSLDMWATGCVAAQVIALGSRGLFESGDLGSDLTLVKSIFETLGTPDAKSWPEVSSFPDWGKMLFREFPARAWSDILSGADSAGLDLVAGLVRYQSTDRLTADDALKSVYLAEP